MKNLKTFENFHNNYEPRLIEQIDIEGEKYNVFLHDQDKFKAIIYVEDQDGEPYINVSTILGEDNRLTDAFWVKSGGEEEEIADKLTKLVKTNLTAKGGFNTYIKYDFR